MENKFLKNLTRRTFLKGAAATSATVALAGCSSDDSGQIVVPSTSTTQEPTIYPEEVFKGVCRPNCANTCQLDLTVRNNKIVKISRARAGENETGVKGLNEEGYQDRMCLRGLSNIQRMYSPTRILYPMKRVSGKRGDRTGFKQITWKEAIDEIATKMVEITATDSRAFAVMPGSPSYSIVSGTGPHGIISSSLGFTYIGGNYDLGLPLGLQRVFGPARFPFFNANETTDIVNANTIFIWGNNATETFPQTWHMIADARDVRKRAKIKANGISPANLKDKATLITVDPMFTITASKSDYHVAPRIGSDAALALGMLREIMYTHESLNDGWIDWEYLFQDTVAPFLVHPTSGKFIREKDIIAAPYTSTDGDGYVMWNKTTSSFVYTNKPVAGAYRAHQRTMPLNSLTTSDVEMINEVSVTMIADGSVIQTKPSYRVLKDSVAEWTLEKTSNYSGLTQDVIKTMAELYAHPDNKPVFSIPGLGTDHYYNGHHFAHAIASIACVTGNFAKSGATCGVHVPFGFLFAGVSNKVSKAHTSINYMRIGEVMDTGMYNGNPYPAIKGLWIFGCNAVSNYTDSEKYCMEKIINKMDFIVTVDITMTDTAACSDIILPAKYWFELEDAIGKGSSPFMLLNEKAVEPNGSPVSDYEIVKRVIEAVDAKINTGISANVAYTEEEYMKLRIDNTTMNSVYPSIFTGDKKLSLDRLRREKSVRYLFSESGEVPYIHCEDKIYRGNASLRAEFYSEVPFVLAAPDDWSKERVPTWVQPNEAWDLPGENDALVAKYPLAYQQEHQRWKVHTTWFDTPWLEELGGEPYAYINPADANGIATGDKVKVSNDRGYVIVKAYVTEKMPKGQLNIPKGFQRYQFIEGCYQNMTSAAYHKVSATQIFYDSRVKVEKV